MLIDEFKKKYKNKDKIDLYLDLLDSIKQNDLDSFHYLLTESKLKKSNFLELLIQPVSISCKTGNLDIFKSICEIINEKKLLSSNQDIYDYFNNGINFSFNKGHLNIIQFFLNHYNFTPSTDPKDIIGNHIFLSFKFGHVNSVKYILQFIENKLSKAELGNLHEEFLVSAMVKENIDVIKYLIIDLNVKKTDNIINAIEDLYEEETINLVTELFKTQNEMEVLNTNILKPFDNKIKNSNIKI